MHQNTEGHVKAGRAVKPSDFLNPDFLRTTLQLPRYVTINSYIRCVFVLSLTPILSGHDDLVLSVLAIVKTQHQNGSYFPRESSEFNHFCQQRWRNFEERAFKTMVNTQGIPIHYFCSCRHASSSPIRTSLALHSADLRSFPHELKKRYKYVH